MSKDITLDMVQVKQLGMLLKKLPDSLPFKVVISGLRSAALPMKKQMKSNAASISSKISKSIGVMVLKKAKLPTITVGIQRKLMDKAGGFIWRFWEYGTTVRKPRKAKYLRFWSVKTNSIISVKQVAAIPARPFLRPAIDSTIKKTEKGVILNIRKSLVRYLRRHKKKFA